MARRRLDAELVRRHLARSRDHARELIDAGSVRVRGTVATKAATQVEEADPIVVAEGEAADGYVSRGAHKLIGALDAFPRVVVAGRDCLDAGASTGGFTQVLLERGAARVLAVDVGYGQLAWPVRTDPRVSVMERTNVRSLAPADVPWRRGADRGRPLVHPAGAGPARPRGRVDGRRRPRADGQAAVRGGAGGRGRRRRARSSPPAIGGAGRGRCGDRAGARRPRRRREPAARPER